jgi:hypothetical protein
MRWIRPQRRRVVGGWAEPLIEERSHQSPARVKSGRKAPAPGHKSAFDKASSFFCDS